MIVIRSNHCQSNNLNCSSYSDVDHLCWTWWSVKFLHIIAQSCPNHWGCWLVSLLLPILQNILQYCCIHLLFCLLPLTSDNNCRIVELFQNQIIYQKSYLISNLLLYQHPILEAIFDIDGDGSIWARWVKWWLGWGRPKCRGRAPVPFTTQSHNLTIRLKVSTNFRGKLHKLL